MHIIQSKKPIHCLYCQKEIASNSSLVYYLVNDDGLCEECRKQLAYCPCKIKIQDIEVKSFYQYNEMMKGLILQYKECYDEALKDIFFAELKDKIHFKYHDYKVVLVPSSKTNLKRRGFNHLALMCQSLRLPIADILEKRNDISQNNLNYAERFKMVENIQIKQNATVPEKILLIDDLLTTGSSIYGAYKALKPYSEKIVPITLSYVNQVVHSKI